MHTSLSGSAVCSPAAKLKRTHGSPATSTTSANSHLTGKKPTLLQPSEPYTGTTKAVPSES